MSIALVLLVVLGCNTPAALAQSGQDECKTPNNQRGSCIVIDNCGQLYNIALKAPNLSQDELNFLRKSGCGWENERPKVCCPTSSATPTPPKRPTQGTPGVNLLPGLDVCGIHEKERVFGGEVAGYREFPWAVLIEFTTPRGRGFKCGGTLISKRYVLTAAHCLKKIPSTWNLVSVRLGEHDFSKVRDCEDERPGFEVCNDPPIDVSVEQAIAHGQYKTTTIDEHNDIALLRLSREVTFTKYITPICLPPTDFLNRDYAGLTPTVAGWGQTENSSFSTVKLKLDVPVVSERECLPKYKRLGAELFSKQLCAGGAKGKDSCKGDSGGPLMIQREENWFIIGVVSFGPTPCGIQGFPGVYTKVADYRDWIISNMKP